MIDLSVIVPTRNRRDSLLRTLAALGRQDYPADRFEVIVAVDHTADDTVAAVRSTPFRFSVHVRTVDTARGAAAARNLGATLARGPLLLFLDDDIEATPGLLRAHVCAHQQGAQVSTGYLRTEAPGPSDFFQIRLRGWWEAMFAAMRRVGHRHNFRDVLTGNCAIDADLFARIGGFDEHLRCHEDYELGVRALAAGAEVRFAEDAEATHHEETRLPRSLARKRDEGRADVQMVRAHPHLVDSLPLGTFERYATPVEFHLRRLVFEWPSAGRLAASALTRALPVLEGARLRGRWQRRLYALLQYWYWRGVADDLPRFAAFRQLRDACRSDTRWRPTSLHVDLSSGLAAAMHLVDARRPDSVDVSYHSERIGTIPAFAGAERLKGLHLQASLARDLGTPLLAALARAGVAAIDTSENLLRANGPLPRSTLAL